MTRELLFPRLLAAFFAIALCFTASNAFADEAAAAEYYQQATEAYQAGDLRKAADLLDKAFGQDPDLVYKYNRILALQGLGEFELALSELNTMYGPMKNDGQNRFDNIDEIKAQLEAEVEKIKAAQEPPDETTGDGTEDGEGDGGEVVAPEPEPKGPNIPAFALLGVGGASLITGTIFATGLTIPDEVDCFREGVGSTVEGETTCLELAFEQQQEGAPNYSEADAYDDSESAVKSVRVVSIVFLGVGVAATAVGAILLLTDKGGDEAPPASAGLDSIRLLPYVGAGEGGAVFQMRF